MLGATWWPTNKLLILPLIWNLTERAVTFQAAKATVMTPADADIEIDIVVGAALTGADLRLRAPRPAS